MEFQDNQNIENMTIQDTCDTTHVTDVESLSDMFDFGFKMYDSIDKIEKSINTPEVQSTYRRIIAIFENATQLVSLANIFSDNECFEEVATDNLKYFLLPALLGSLSTKITDFKNRLSNLSAAEIYFIDFLKRLKSYQLNDINFSKLENCQNNEDEQESRRISNLECITHMVSTRNEKVERYKYQKELEKKLALLKKALDDPCTDEESKREYFITLLKIFANKAIDELNLIASEKTIIQHKAKTENDSTMVKNYNRKPSDSSNNFKTVIITRNAMQKKVYGVGYPSLPVMSVEEFYDKKIKDGEWAKQECLPSSSTSQESAGIILDECSKKDKEDEENEEKIEKDDFVSLERTRRTDEYKDVYRRGWGNRHNRS
ncbi:immunoglobulin-binding protein 1 [Copidosoma floridanum]|uniref:immunoglobulin-binding protein 1 n=1 Tax=Copidosoma floridanum TaxID=29053 RepID=UPI0006C9997B|nr:immunoglobulin-binding protein 1 [Copidosoma floridanum]